jgi:hypothetical protein
MGSNVSSAPFGHVQCLWKSTELQNIRKTVLPWCKMMISAVKNGCLLYFFSPILFRLLF